jgi:predicted secreted protein
MSKAQSTLGTKLFVETATTGTFVAIGEITAVGSITDDSASDIDVSSLDSTEYKEYISGLKDPPSVDFGANYVADDTGQLRIQTLFASGAVVKFKLTVGKALTQNGDPLTIIRSGYVSKCGFDTPVDNKISLNFTVRFSGAPTITAAD